MSCSQTAQHVFTIIVFLNNELNKSDNNPHEKTTDFTDSGP